MPRLQAGVGAASCSPLQWPFKSASSTRSLQLSSSASTSPAAPVASQAAFYFILITVAFDMLAFGIIAPVLPDLIRQFQGGDFARASAITGYFGLGWATMQFIFSPLLGAWSDRFGRRPVILISCFGLAIDYVFMAACSLAPLALRRAARFRYHHFEHRHRLRLRHGCYTSRKTRQALRPHQRRIWPGLRRWPRRRRLFGRHQFAFSLLGRRRTQSRQRHLRLFHPSRISASRAPRKIRLAHGQSTRSSRPSSFSSRARRTIHRPHPLLPRSQFPSFHVGPLYRISLFLEPPRRRQLFNPCRRVRCAGFRRPGRPTSKALWRTPQCSPRPHVRRSLDLLASLLPLVDGSSSRLFPLSHSGESLLPPFSP